MVPIGLGGEIECGDDKRAMFLLRVRLVSGVDGGRYLMGFFYVWVIIEQSLESLWVELKYSGK